MVVTATWGFFILTSACLICAEQNQSKNGSANSLYDKTKANEKNIVSQKMGVANNQSSKVTTPGYKIANVTENILNSSHKEANATKNTTNSSHKLANVSENDASSGNELTKLKEGVVAISDQKIANKSDNVSSQNNRINSPIPETLHIGEAINILPRYGSLALSMKVISLKNKEKTIFFEKSAKIFKPNTYWANFVDQQKKPNGFDDHFLIDFCDNSKDLYSAYFDHFEIEGMQDSYNAFISSLSGKSKAEAFGIIPSYLHSDEISYVLVRLFKRETRALLDGAPELSPDFWNASENIRVGYSQSAHQFMDKFGTHVIVEYELGNVIYQVFVFGKTIYRELKNTFSMSYEEARGNFASNNESSSDLNDIKKYFTPRYAMLIGQVKIASGNPHFKSLKTKVHSGVFRTYQSIFEILKEREVAKDFQNIKDTVITGLRLKKLTKALPATRNRYWLADILDNTLSLYYTTL